MDSVIQLPLKDEEEIVEKAKDWALMHGVAMRPRDCFNEDSLSFAPFTLLPSAMKKADFLKALQVQKAMSELIHRVAHDHLFLASSLKKTIQYDDFTRKLYEIYSTVRSEGYGQVMSLGIFRSDYLYDEGANGMKQVEFNTIASSFAGLSTQVSNLHRYVLQELGNEALTESLPENQALKGVCAGIVHAWDIYDEKKSVVMFLVEDVTYNICDQRFMEFELRRQQPLIRVIRRTFSDLSSAKLGPKKQLILNDGLEVAVVYMRTGYSPDQYKGEKDWEVRLLMERSRAFKCPSVHYHLAGTKKVQQVLATPGVVERYISNSEDAKNIRALFTNIYSLDLDAEGDSAFDLAMKNPENYVLKPQREGGGNNTYGNDIPTVLKKMTPEERQAMILMQIIKPVPNKNIIVQRNSPIKVSDIISELGVFSYIIGSATDIVAIKPAGHMLRSKLATSSEGGVASGYGALDSPFLI